MVYKTLCRLKWDRSLNVCFSCGYNLADAPVQYIPESDGILDVLQAFFSTAQVSEVGKILKLAWFISNHCGLLDPVFGHHPLTSDMDVIQHWHNYSFKANIFLFLET